MSKLVRILRSSAAINFAIVVLSALIEAIKPTRRKK